MKTRKNIFIGFGIMLVLGILSLIDQHFNGEATNISYVSSLLFCITLISTICITLIGNGNTNKKG